MMPEIERWRTTWRGLGVEPADERLFEAVMARYAEPHRAYHTARHLDECFARLNAVTSLADHIYEVELALWFHDAVYEARRHDNEEQSASWAREAVLQAGLPIPVAGRVHDLILATKHDAVPATPDAALLVDIDLTILAAPIERFDEYERQVRQEYSWVPGFLFRRKRREILQAFLARPYIYSTEHFRMFCEALARANLERSIRSLGGKSAQPY